MLPSNQPEKSIDVAAGNNFADFAVVSGDKGEVEGISCLAFDVAILKVGLLNNHASLKQSKGNENLHKVN